MRRPTVCLVACLVPLFAVACGGGETKEPMPETVEGAVPEETVAEGDPAAGKEVYDSASPACGTCHTFAAAGSNAETGPNLDESLKGKDAQYILEAIVNPDAEIAEGFQEGVMPKTYGQDLSDKQLADLVAFLQQGA